MPQQVKWLLNIFIFILCSFLVIYGKENWQSFLWGGAVIVFVALAVLRVYIEKCCFAVAKGYFIEASKPYIIIYRILLITLFLLIAVYLFVLLALFFVGSLETVPAENQQEIALIAGTLGIIILLPCAIVCLWQFVRSFFCLKAVSFFDMLLQNKLREFIRIIVLLVFNIALFIMLI